MSNLIITVISIALVAVAALMAVFYGGDAFSSGNVKSQAVTLINATNQIALAWQAYALDRSGDYTITAGTNGLNTTLAPTYLSQRIVLPAIVSGSGNPNPILWTMAGDGGHYVSNSNSMQWILSSKDICQQINKVIQNTTSTSTYADSVMYDMFARGYCFLNGGQYIYIYRVWP